MPDVELSSETPSIEELKETRTSVSESGEEADVASDAERDAQEAVPAEAEYELAQEPTLCPPGCKAAFALALAVAEYTTGSDKPSEALSTVDEEDFDSLSSNPSLEELMEVKN
ncbi:hypothetical protein A6E15_07615 [Natrinema saccharevitans]|uniref:Uncharacterized protein n=2 Tax=Natrinema saccharevitans TaxID=301967 RepID=A0A1S8AWZ2_9EURY|nr:hypothetical protein A6E15_07615 [Natrinema saccharevitans]